MLPKMMQFKFGDDERAKYFPIIPVPTGDDGLLRDAHVDEITDWLSAQVIAGKMNQGIYTIYKDGFSIATLELSGFGEAGNDD